LKISVSVLWDADAHVWVATSDNVPGLATEADTLEILTDKLKVMLPDLVENDNPHFDVTYLMTI
jgi:Domain of unknown function (DUF1902)